MNILSTASQSNFLLARLKTPEAPPATDNPAAPAATPAEVSLPPGTYTRLQLEQILVAARAQARVELIRQKYSAEAGQGPAEALGTEQAADYLKTMAGLEGMPLAHVTAAALSHSNPTEAMVVLMRKHGATLNYDKLLKVAHETGRVICEQFAEQFRDSLPENTHFFTTSGATWSSVKLDKTHLTAGEKIQSFLAEVPGLDMLFTKPDFKKSAFEIQFFPSKEEQTIRVRIYFDNDELYRVGSEFLIVLLEQAGLIVESIQLR